jgi:outer membrane receptor protein involved in Fe transport
MRLRASAYRSFRNPTLNELFREFRVGNTVTQANAGLTPESLWGAEAGLDRVGERSRFHLTVFRNSLDHLITNVTISTTGGTIVRQRRNASAAVSRGFEAGYDRHWGNLTGELAYLLVDSRYATGLRVAQVPKHQGSATLSYQRGGTWGAIGGRASSYQFDDDLNTRNSRLAGYPAFFLMLRQRLTPDLSMEAAIENILGRRFYAAFTPTPNTGMPRQWRLGLRWDGNF